MNACARIAGVACRRALGGITATCSYGESALWLSSLQETNQVIFYRRQWSSQPDLTASSSSQTQSPIDTFTAGLQKKTELELLELIQKSRADELRGADGKAGEEVEEVANPETGELYGPRGKEPTRFGDWELKGKCVDF
ncbi:hypothetical protein Vretimale_18808 [Volvox reticuliferus]|uniref:Succinate dehydrogenase assembly factor 4, mitochondrial n=1 Tax=Volvox reticuliferus TaxID=1737510 RepID=A0A8J4LZV7_9CHLO|nr:hypothetical protein Vretimale_18808 [Volvox reticuliferus]